MAGRTSLLALVATFCSVALADNAPHSESLYARLGGASTLSALVSEAGAHLGPRRQDLESSICALAGGGCASPNAGLALSDTEFVTLLEQLRSSMRTHGVPLAARNELLEALAPMRRGLARH
jgi:hypothetical protein